MKNSLVAIVLVIAIVASGVVGYAGTGRVAVTTFTTTDSAPTVIQVQTEGITLTKTVTTVSTVITGAIPQTETVNSTLGLELRLEVNSTTIPSEDAINVSVSVLNALSKENNLTASNDWPIQGLTSSSCNNFLSAVGIAIFRGYYVMNNLSSASPLGIWAGIECPLDYAFNNTEIVGVLQNITSYSFLPNSDGGYYSAYYSSGSSMRQGVFPTRLVDGGSFYAANSTGLPYNSLLSSLPANYTLAAGDEWGQLVLLHFQVTASNNLPQVGEFLAAGGCYENSDPVPCITSTLSGAIIFNCASAAATSAGCAWQVSTGMTASTQFPVQNYTITVWYPYINEPNEPSYANCMFSVNGDTTSPYGHCFLVNSTAFALSPL